MADMPTDPRATIESAARDLVRLLADLPTPPTARVAEVEGPVACLILVWDAKQLMPTVGAERRRLGGGRRAGCKADIVEAVRVAGKPLTRKEVVKALREGKKGHGTGTVAKALAELTRAGELVNQKDKKGYRLPGWRRETPSLFD
jgi:hypothetical protein